MDSDDEFAGMDDLPLDEATFREIDQRTMEYMSQIAVDAAPNASQGAGTFANLKEMNVYSMPPGDNRMMPYQHDGEISTLKRKLADLQSDNLKLKESQNGLHFKHQKEFEALQLDYESKVKKLETEMRFKDQELYTYKLSQPRHTSMRDGGTVTKESRDAGVMTDVELEQSPISSTPGHKAAEAFSVEKRLKDILFKTYAELKDSGPTSRLIEYHDNLAL
ncbi:hypothetical protein BC829DRAFT_379088 [Chytridium lagenaria]|nr:hypothetical protein BC829DRAFT_379088 [Chytridium lagenaria]